MVDPEENRDTGRNVGPLKRNRRESHCTQLENRGKRAEAEKVHLKICSKLAH